MSLRKDCVFKCAKRDDGVGCRYFGLIHHDLKLVQRRYTCSMMFIRLQNSEFPDFTIQSIFLSAFPSKSSSLIPQPPSPIQWGHRSGHLWGTLQEAAEPGPHRCGPHHLRDAGAAAWGVHVAAELPRWLEAVGVASLCAADAGALAQPLRDGELDDNLDIPWKKAQLVETEWMRGLDRYVDVDSSYLRTTTELNSK